MKLKVAPHKLLRSKIPNAIIFLSLTSWFFIVFTNITGCQSNLLVTRSRFDSIPIPIWTAKHWRISSSPTPRSYWIPVDCQHLASVVTENLLLVNMLSLHKTKVIPIKEVIPILHLCNKVLGIFLHKWWKQYITWEFDSIGSWLTLQYICSFFLNFHYSSSFQLA